jgi:uncharacterized protein (DUF1778 family)
MSAFILESATDRAAELLMDQRLFLLNDQSWSEFAAALDGPAGPVSALVDLFRSDL